MEGTGRVLPKGEQSFEQIRRNGMLYVDKTDLVWKLAHDGKYNYLSRPRRFGKSLLISTLACYFEGKRELFEDLKIMDLEKEWTAHPVIRLDMSRAGSSAVKLEKYLNKIFAKYEETYGVKSVDPDDFTGRLADIICTAAEKTGQQAVVLIDEYDYPLQHSWQTPEHEECTRIYRDVFTVLKSETDNLRSVFITGVTKFTQISLFSALNNLNNISFLPAYATICGMTRDEIVATFTPEIEALAQANEQTPAEALDELKEYYDGYHFSERNMVDVYNPYSLVLSLANQDICNYWISTGATTLIDKFVSDFNLRMNDFEGIMMNEDTLKTSDVKAGEDALFLYQSGYLTIKSYNKAGRAYILGYPNTEVREALYGMVLPALAANSDNKMVTRQIILRESLAQCDLPAAMEAMKGLVADVPYSNKRLESMYVEERYRLIVSNVIAAVGLRVEVEHMMSGGRIDVVAYGRNFIYVIELKLTNAGGIAAAERQILANNYAQAFAGDARRVVAVAIEFQDEGKGMIEWKGVEVG